MSDVSHLPGISGLSFDYTFLSRSSTNAVALSVVPFSANGPFSDFYLSLRKMILYISLIDLFA